MTSLVSDTACGTIVSAEIYVNPSLARYDRLCRLHYLLLPILLLYLSSSLLLIRKRN